MYGIGQRCRAAAPVSRSCGVGAVAIAEGAPGCSSGRQDPRVRLLNARGYSTVALVGWKAVERWVSAGAEAQRDGARRSGVEAALGFGWGGRRKVGCGEV